MIKKGHFQWQKQTIKKKKKGRKLYNVVLCNRQVVDPNPGLEKWKRKEESLLLQLKQVQKKLLENTLLGNLETPSKEHTSVREGVIMNNG